MSQSYFVLNFCDRIITAFCSYNIPQKLFSKNISLLHIALESVNSIKALLLDKQAEQIIYYCKKKGFKFIYIYIDSLQSEFLIP